MSLPAMRWEIKPAASADQLRRFPGSPPLLVQLLVNRGVADAAAAVDFLHPKGRGADPFQMKGIQPAAEQLRRAIERGAKIVVYGDFDADGVTATALLVQVLRAAGAEAERYIPDRVDEGYGVNARAFGRLCEAGVGLVVTVDCGIRSVAEVKEFQGKLDVIITDHHLPGPELPPAASVINPKQPGCPYPFKHLAGVGIAYKLAQALLRGRGGTLPAGLRDRVYELVALGTVADLAPLTGDNRVMVKRGLDAINKAPSPGVAALMINAGLPAGQVKASDIGFRLGPRLNAAGRIANATPAYELLTATDEGTATRLAGELGALNARRQVMTDEAVAAAVAEVEHEQRGASLLMAAAPHYAPGIVGLAAGRLAELYYRPSIVVQTGPDQSRGSCRSIPEFNVIEALDKVGELLIRHGGHAAAAGFTVATRDLGTLYARLEALAAEQLTGRDLRPTLTIDSEVPLERVRGLYALLSQIEPCGQENPTPILLSRQVPVSEVRTVGANGQHLKLTLGTQRDSWDAILFRGGALRDQVPGVIDVAYCLQAKEWEGQAWLQLEVQDFQAST